MEIVYLDKRIVVCVKPAGILSTDEEGGLPSLIRKELADERACVRTVHRLDQVVGGLMVLARSVKAASLLSAQIENRTFEKEYLAVVRGTPAQARGEMTDLLGRDKALRRTYVADAPGKDIAEGRLSYEVLSQKEGLSLVKIRLHTGRTHQIRVQFSSRGLPLVGDRKYGKEEDGETPIALFSCTLGFTHPESGKAMRFTHLPPASYPWDLFETNIM